MFGSKSQKNPVFYSEKMPQTDTHLLGGWFLCLGILSYSVCLSFSPPDSSHLPLLLDILKPKMAHQLSGPALRDTARLSQRHRSIARYGVFGVSRSPIGCNTPSPFSERFPLGEHAKWRCDTLPPAKGVSQRYLRDTYENKANWCDTPSAILSRKGIARFGGVSCTGPLSPPKGVIGIILCDPLDSHPNSPRWIFDPQIIYGAVSVLRKSLAIPRTDRKSGTVRKIWCIAKRGCLSVACRVVYKSQPGGFINWGVLIKLKGLLCGNPTQKEGKF